MSGNTSYRRSNGRQRGRQRELRYAEWLRTEGWWAWRLESGCADIVASRPLRGPGKVYGGAEVLLIQVKSTSAGPYSHFGPADREALLAQAEEAGARAVLVWWPKGFGIGKARWIESGDWP